MLNKTFIKRSLILLISIILFTNITTMMVSAAVVTVGKDKSSNFVNSQFYILGNSKVPTRTSLSGPDNGHISPNDLCKVKKIANSTYWQVEYPTSKGKKTAYVKKSYILSNTNYSKSLKINSNETVYTKSDMKTKFGTVYTSDNITLLSPIKDGKAQIMYNVSGGYKIGWIKASTSSSNTISVKLNKTSLSLLKAESSTLTATVTAPSNTSKSVSWTSSNPKVAKVDSKGKVTAVGNGTATITVKTASGGKTATCTVTVKTPSSPTPTSVSLNKTSLPLENGKTFTLTATVKAPTNANKNISWTSSNPKVAKVDSKGKVTAVGNGTATITVKTASGGKTATCTVTVKAPQSKVEAAINNKTLKYAGIEYTVDNIKYKGYYEPGKYNKPYSPKVTPLVFIKSKNIIETDRVKLEKLSFLRYLNEENRDFDSTIQTLYKDIISTYSRIESSYFKINVGVSLISSLISKDPSKIVQSNAKYIKDKSLNPDTYILAYNIIAIKEKIVELENISKLRKKGPITDYSKLGSFGKDYSNKFKSIHKNYAILFKNVTGNSKPFDVMKRIVTTSKSTLVSSSQASKIINTAKNATSSSKLKDLNSTINGIIDSISVPANYLSNSPLTRITDNAKYSQNLSQKYK